MTKLNASGTEADLLNYLGGTRIDSVNGIALDPSGNAYVTGLTSSEDFPTTQDVLERIPAAHS